jgi:glycosyltransferase involved in cell wall biosynthesis
MSQPTRFSVLIPTFERADLLGQAIESALGQTHDDREIVVIDDGSTDDTRSVAARYEPAIRYLRQENRGKAAALNFGVEATAGDAIIVLDDDDLFPPWALARHCEALSRNPAADFSYGRYVRFLGKTQPAPSDLWDEEFVPTRDPRRLVVKLMESCFLPNPTWAVRRDAQLRTGPYDETMYRSQDFNMIVRLARANEGVFVDDRVLYQRTHVAMRGPTFDRSYTEHTVDKWIKYDALFFQALDREWRAHDFRPFSEEGSDGGEALALLQKGIILFQRKVYEGADRALDQYRRVLDARRPNDSELKIATGLLGCRHGIADLADRASLGGAVAARLRAMRWPFWMRVAFATQLRWRVRAALKSGDARFAGRLLQYSREAFGLAATAAVMGSRYSAGASQWRA